MLPDISSLKRICSVKRGYVTRHILFEEHMLSQKRICSEHILFGEDMLSQEGICSQPYPL
jgi:hypothetical protein